MCHVVAVSIFPGLARSLWGGTGAWMGVLLCLIAMVYQSIHLGNLQKELSLLQRSKDGSRLEVRELCETPLCPRQKRELPGTRKRRHNGARVNTRNPLTARDTMESNPAHTIACRWSGLCCSREDMESSAFRGKIARSPQPHHIICPSSTVLTSPEQEGSRSILHLIPKSLSSNEPQDLTEISWAASVKKGKSLEVQGRSVKVKNSGVYYIYSQVFYKDNTFIMGHLVMRRAYGDLGESDILLRCVQSMQNNQSLSYNTCYTAGVFSLQKGNIITLIIPRKNANLDASSHATFLGFVRL